MWLEKAEVNLDGVLTTTQLGEQWHVIPRLATLAAIQAGMGVVRRRFPGVTLKGFEFVPLDHYVQVTLTSTNGTTWSASKSKPRFKAPRNLPTRKLYKYLDPLIQDAVNNPFTVSAPLPLTVAYTLGTRVLKRRIESRRIDWYKEPERFDHLDSSLYPPTMLFDGLYWLTHVQYADRMAKIEKRNFDYQIPTLVIWESALERLGLPLKVAPLNMHGLVDLMSVQYNSSLRGWVSYKLPDLPSDLRLVLGFVLDLVRRCVQLNPPESLEDSVRGLNTSGVVLLRGWDALKHTGFLNEEKLKRVFPNLQFLVTDLDL